jgi:hypothetical protein
VWLGWAFVVDSRVIRQRFTLGDLDLGISEIVISNDHGDGYAMYAI